MVQMFNSYLFEADKKRSNNLRNAILLIVRLSLQSKQPAKNNELAFLLEFVSALNGTSLFILPDDRKRLFNCLKYAIETIETENLSLTEKNYLNEFISHEDI